MSDLRNLQALVYRMVNEANSQNPPQVIRQSISINDFKWITIFFSYSTILHI